MKISILPTTSEIQSNRSEYLPLKNRSTPHHETGIQRLLDSQFRLLREDTAGQLRDAVCALVEGWDVLIRGKDKNAKRRFLRQIDAKMSIFDRIKLTRMRFDRRKGLVVDVSFAQPEKLSEMDSKKRQHWWEESRDLQVGSLVALIDDTKATSFFLVSDRLVYKSRGKEESKEQFQKSGLKDLAGDPNRAMITLCMVDPTSDNDQARLMDFSRAPPRNAVLVEFSGMLFASFEPILRCLQALHQHPNLPFTQWLAPDGDVTYRVDSKGLVEIPPPIYLSRNAGIRLDLSCITNDKFPLSFSMDNPTTIQELEAHTTLDRGQCESLLMSLKCELALVQGPPGTGKSYVGNKIVQILLKNRHKLKIGPIICVCKLPKSSNT